MSAIDEESSQDVFYGGWSHIIGMSSNYVNTALEAVATEQGKAELLDKIGDIYDILGERGKCGWTHDPRRVVTGET